MSYINKATVLPLQDSAQRLNQHIETMNNDGWELMTVTIEMIGIAEMLLMFWKKLKPEQSRHIPIVPTGLP